MPASQLTMIAGTDDRTALNGNKFRKIPIRLTRASDLAKLAEPLTRRCAYWLVPSEVSHSAAPLSQFYTEAVQVVDGIALSAPWRAVPCVRSQLNLRAYALIL